MTENLADYAPFKTIWMINGLLRLIILQWNYNVDGYARCMTANFVDHEIAVYPRPAISSNKGVGVITRIVISL